MFEINVILNSEYPIMVRSTTRSAWIKGHVVEATQQYIMIRKHGGGMVTVQRDTIIGAQYA